MVSAIAFFIGFLIAAIAADRNSPMRLLARITGTQLHCPYCETPKTVSELETLAKEFAKHSAMVTTPQFERSERIKEVLDCCLREEPVFKEKFNRTWETFVRADKERMAQGNGDGRSN